MHFAAQRTAPRVLGTARSAAAAPLIRSRFLQPVYLSRGAWRWASSSSSSSPTPRRRPWKAFRNGILRLALAVATVYWYNTSPIFADELSDHMRVPPPTFSDADMPTVDAIVQEKRQRAAAQAPAAAAAEAPEPAPALAAEAAQVPAPKRETEQQQQHEPGSPEALENEASRQGAFDPETGEINWDCPCLGGMADGPCGEEFKAAFSCFVHSEEDPKGMDCIDKFSGMRDCFRKHPDVYGNELNDDDEDDGGGQPLADGEAPPVAAAATEPGVEDSVAAKVTTDKSADSSTPARTNNVPKEDDKAPVQKPKKGPVSQEVPRDAFDATDANGRKSA